MAKSVYRTPHEILTKQGLFSSSEKSTIFKLKHIWIIILFAMTILLFLFMDKIFKNDDDS